MDYFQRISLRKATKADIPFLMNLRFHTMKKHLITAGKTPTKEDLSLRVRDNFDFAKIVLLENEPIGILKVIRNLTEWEISQIQIIPDLQGNKIGSFLLESIISEAKANNIDLKLSVLKMNPALSLYERLGFKISGETEIAFKMHLLASQ